MALACVMTGGEGLRPRRDERVLWCLCTTKSQDSADVVVEEEMVGMEDRRSCFRRLIFGWLLISLGQMGIPNLSTGTEPE